MAKAPDKDAVNKFLGNFKRLFGKRGLNILWSRNKNKETITKLGFTRLDVIDEILKLTHIDYIDGPKTDIDNNFPGKIWEFGKIINCEEIYIKLKINNDEPFCFSFHFPEKKMVYPFK